MKRTSQLKRRTPLKRASVVRGRGKTKTRSSSGDLVRDPEYLAAVRTLFCCAPMTRPMSGPNKGCLVRVCHGIMHAHHAGRRPGVGMKCSDLETIPLCGSHHMQWHAGSGVFIGWDKARRMAWADEQIAFTQAALAHLLPTPAEGKARRGR